MESNFLHRLRLIGVLCGLFVGALLYTGPTVAALPPRPTLTPTAPPASAPDNRARILLQAGYAYEGKWSVVQWQGGDGIWHDVEGWWGQIVGGQVHWGVTEKDFATGPFRWLVYDKAGGQLLATSASFHLPDSITHTVTVTATATP